MASWLLFLCGSNYRVLLPRLTSSQKQKPKAPHGSLTRCGINSRLRNDPQTTPCTGSSTSLQGTVTAHYRCGLINQVCFGWFGSFDLTSCWSKLNVEWHQQTSSASRTHATLRNLSMNNMVASQHGIFSFGFLCLALAERGFN